MKTLIFKALSTVAILFVILNYSIYLSTGKVIFDDTPRVDISSRLPSKDLLKGVVKKLPQSKKRFINGSILRQILTTQQRFL